MFKCDECGDIDHVVLDGYSFGERLLEGVEFEVRIENGQFVAKVNDSDVEYFNRLNTKMWLEEAVEAAKYSAQCPKCDLDVEIESEPKPKPQPIEIKMSPMSDIMDIFNKIVDKKNPRGNK